MGIPVLVGNRGALPETVGDAGLVVDIPEVYQPDSTQVPRADDISPWVETIIRLWDDSSLRRQVGERCTAHSQRWHPSRTVPIYEEFFRHLRPQPGPPLLPKWSDDWVRRLDLPGIYAMAGGARHGEAASIRGSIRPTGAVARSVRTGGRIRRGTSLRRSARPRSMPNGAACRLLPPGASSGVIRGRPGGYLSHEEHP